MSGGKQREDLSGKRFGKLTVVSLVKVNSNYSGKWLCKCDCGKEINATDSKLKNGRTKSCGCLLQTLYDREGTGYTHLPEYHSYSGAKSRCENTRNEKYLDYGGRGIEFHFTSFQQFIDHLGYKPSPKHSLDRINNDGNYELGNVKWSTREEQMNNRRAFSKERILQDVLVAYAKAVMGEL